MSKTVWHRWSPLSLQNCSLQAVSQLLLQLNDVEIGPDFIWLRNECNPFIGIPNTVIEEILEDFKNSLLVSHKTVRKELLQIVNCKRVKKIVLTHFLIKEDDVNGILRMIEPTKSNLTYFGVPTRNGKGKSISWMNIPNAYTYLMESLKTMPSLTHLNVNGVCNDEMLGIIGDCCPNLIVLVAISDEITGGGLKNLCEKKNGQLKRCEKLQKIRLFTKNREEEEEPLQDEGVYLSGIESLLLNLPQLRILECCPLDLGKVLVRIHENDRLRKFNLREWTYDGMCENLALPSVIAKTCPSLTYLKIWNTSNEELKRFEHIESLRSVIVKKDAHWVDFNNGVAPFLEKTGKNVESLTLLFFDEINYNVIDQYCGTLNRLYCCSFDALNGRVTTSPSFKHLEYLSLTSGLRTGLQPLECILLLSPCINLQYLILNCCDGLKKHHLKQIILRNPLSNLLCAHIESAFLSIQGTLLDLKNFAYV